ncbi:MAG: hypothetical protein N4A40_05925 [Tissierellales bacterium]|jgi:hypothetical protein|nr:hypothetical protein [Tissierellales bacterium]
MKAKVEIQLEILLYEEMEKVLKKQLWGSSLLMLALIGTSVGVLAKGEYNQVKYQNDLDCIRNLTACEVMTGIRFELDDLNDKSYTNLKIQSHDISAKEALQNLMTR